MLDGRVLRAIGRAGSVRRSQESNFYTIFCKTGSRDNRDLMGVWAEVGKVPSCMVTQGQELEWGPELSGLRSPPWDCPWLQASSLNSSPAPTHPSTIPAS